jgi:membrane protein DedA with SNARE-associated domain
MFAGITEWVTDVIDTLGYVGVSALVALENVFPPIPSEVVLPLAGFVAGRGDANLVGMIVAATIGSVVGAWILYGIAAAIGPARLHRFVHRYGRWFGVGSADLTKAETWFDKRATSAVLVGRCVPLVRSLVSIPAGFRRMEPVRFTVSTAVGSAVWNVALIGAGAILGDRWDEVGDYVGVLQWIVVAAVVGLVGWFAWKRLIRPRFSAAGGSPPGRER